MKHIIAVLLENEPGALSRVVGLFSARGYNIESLTVAPTDDPTLSRLTLTTSGDEQKIEQVTKQLNKLINTIKVIDFTDEEDVVTMPPERLSALTGLLAAQEALKKEFEAAGAKILHQAQEACHQLAQRGIAVTALAEAPIACHMCWRDLSVSIWPDCPETETVAFERCSRVR